MKYKKREKKLVEPIGVLVSRDKRETTYHDPNKPPPLGTYNPKMVSKSVKVWRKYSNELDRHVPKKRKQKKFNFKSLNKTRKKNRMKRAQISKGLKGRFSLKKGSNYSRSAKDLLIMDNDLQRPSEIMEEEGSLRKSMTQSTLSRTQAGGSRGKIGYYKRFPNRPVSGHVKFKLHTKRKPLNDQEVFDVEGTQFSYLEVPRISSRHRPIETFFMKKKQPRGPLFGHIEPDNSDYNPQFEYGKRRINSGVLFFEPITKRKPPGRPSTTKNEDLYDYNGYKGTNRSMILKRIPQTDLEKNIPKELDPESGLPSFLQKGRPMTANTLFNHREKKDRKMVKIMRPTTAKN